jgi:mannose-6-phosphate isomerase
MKAYKEKIFRILGNIQHYSWGGTTFIPGLLNIPNPAQTAFAEYWLGAHDNASAEIINGSGQPVKLNEYIKSFTRETLGSYVADRFGRLPYLLKILDVKDMLSIQVHPNKEMAEIEFANENSQGIALNASHRNYKDDNHKPELMLALSEFWLLHGFKTPEKLTELLLRTEELRILLPIFENGGYRELYKRVMEMEQSRVNNILSPLLARIVPAYQDNRLEKKDENFWAARAALTYQDPHKIDRGIFSIYFFNLLNLHPLDAIFQEAGLPHAYLEGQNVEIMANSDNVLRGGLTSKHVDVAALQKHIKFEQTIPDILHGKGGLNHMNVYTTPASDFELARMVLLKDQSVFLMADTVEIFLLTEGSILLTEEGRDSFRLEKGGSFVAFHNAVFSLNATHDTVIYIAGVPLPY